MQACSTTVHAAAGYAAVAVHRRAHRAGAPPPLPRGQRRQAVATAELPTATDLPSQINAMNAVRKSLRGLGWDDAWIDGVVAEVRKGKLRTSVPQLEQNITYLTSEAGIPLKSVENMAAVAPEWLGASLESIKAAVEYARQRGIAGGALVRLLEENPKLLAFSVSADGKVLEKGKARASVDLAERNGRQVMGVSYWRTGASFESAPVAPYKPSAL